MWCGLPGNTTTRKGRRRKTAGGGQIRGKRQQYQPGGLVVEDKGGAVCVCVCVGARIRRDGGKKKEEAQQLSCPKTS